MPVAASEYHRHDSHMYCAEQINIPVTLPNILKSYAKAAVRTQPYDLLRWTAAYFRALADGEIPPVKARLEYPPDIHPSGITPHFLKALLNQYGYNKDSEKVVGLTERTGTSMHVTLESLLKRWRGLALSDSLLYQILMTGRLLRLPAGPFEDCDLYRFLAIACGLLGNNLLETMIYVCEILTHEPEGGSAMIPLKTFMRLYEFLAELDCSGRPSIIESETHDGNIGADEASLLRSSRSSSQLDSESCGCGPYKVDTECDEDSRHVMVSCLEDGKELAIRDKAGMSCQSRKARRGLEDREVGAESHWNESSRSDGSSVATKPGTETETPRTPHEESGMRSEKSTYNDKKKPSERQFPEGTVEEPAEVTKVQEERRRRRDVEMHSSTEKVKPTDAETTTGKHQQQLDSPAAGAVSASSLLSSSSPSLLGKSHVGPSEPVKGPEDARKASPSDPEGNPNTEDSITARNGNAQRENVGHSANKRKNRGKVKKRKYKKKDKVEQEEIQRDSFEFDDPTMDENQVIRDKKSSFDEDDDLLEQGERIVDEARDPLDYEGEESLDESGNEDEDMYSGDEEVEDMSDYEPIGLENILQGICECLEPTKETIAVSATSATPLDPVLEFIERMRAESPAGPYFTPEIPGIGPPVKPDRVTDVGLWLNDCARRQQGYVAPRNLRHFLCPNLDENTRYEDYYRTKTIGL